MTLSLCDKKHALLEKLDRLAVPATAQIKKKSGFAAAKMFGSIDRQKDHAILYTTQTQQKLKCGPMPNVMVALPNIGGAVCSTPQSLADAHY